VTRSVGVKAGDWVEYDYSVFWKSTKPGATEPSRVTEQRKLEEVRLYVKEVSGLNVTVELTLHFKNGTEKTETFSGDIGKGGISVFLISANLDVGDPIVESPMAPSINETITREYAGAKRDSNHAKISLSFSFLNQSVDLYWDRDTGLLCETLTNGTQYALGGYSETIATALKISETNVWQPESSVTQWWWLWLLVAILTAAAGLGLFKLLRKPKAPEESEEFEAGEQPPSPPNTEQSEPFTSPPAKPKNE